MIIRLSFESKSSTLMLQTVHLSYEDARSVHNETFFSSETLLTQLEGAITINNIKCGLKFLESNW